MFGSIWCDAVFFFKLPKRELLRASMTSNSVCPVSPSVPGGLGGGGGGEQRGMMGYSPLLLSAASSRRK